MVVLLLYAAIGIIAIAGTVSIIGYQLGGIITAAALTFPTVLLLSLAAAWLMAVVERLDRE